MWDLSLNNLSLTELILAGVFVFAWITQLFYFIFFYFRIALYKKTDKKGSQQPVSVIICAKNEEKRIRNLVPALMDQKHPEFEIVIVNDGSWDDTNETLEAFSRTYSNLKIVEIPEEGIRMKGKKFALTLGIKAAKYDRLLLSDADCIPDSDQWITKMSRVSQEKEIVLGYSPYQYRKGFLNKLIRFDTFSIAVNYLSFALAGKPYMGVGRNMSYNKKSFFDVGGFRKHSFITSGDDDLFINQIASKKNTSISIDREAWTYSEPKTNFTDWWYQKKRHLSTSNHYKAQHKFLLGLFPLTYYLLLASFIGLLVLQTLILLVIPIFVTRMILHLIIFKLSGKYLGEKKLTWLSPFWELLMMTINPVIFISNMINKPTEWS